jgi:hypothetical protein
MRRTIAPLPVDHQHLHLGGEGDDQRHQGEQWDDHGRASGGPGKMSLSVQLRGITLEIAGACQGTVA